MILPNIHRTVGRCICAMMFFLAALGYKMRFAPTLRHFDSFSLVFAAPWSQPKLQTCQQIHDSLVLFRLVWAVLIPTTARCGYVRCHQLLSNMALKGCLAVPVARIFTAISQAHFNTSKLRQLSYPCPSSAFHICTSTSQVRERPTMEALSLPPQFLDRGS